MPKYGFSCVISRNTGASWASPTWNATELVRDATLNLERSEFDATVRGMGGFEASEPTTTKAELTFQLLYEPADTDYLAFETAFQTGAAIDMAVLDGPTSTPGSKGLRAKWKIFKFQRNEGLRDALTVDVTAKPCLDTTNPPTWFTAT